MPVYGVSGRFAHFTGRREISCIFTVLSAREAETMHFYRVIWQGGIHAYFSRVGQKHFFGGDNLSGFHHFLTFLSVQKGTFDAYLRGVRCFSAFFRHAKNRLLVCQNTSFAVCTVFF